MRCRDIYDYKETDGTTQRNVVWFNTGKVIKEAYANILFDGSTYKNFQINDSETQIIFSSADADGMSVTVDKEAKTITIVNGNVTYSGIIGNANTPADATFEDIIDYGHQQIPFMCTVNGNNRGGYINVMDEREVLDNYADEQRGVRASLTQRLSVLKNELWYRINYGLPLGDKVVNKAILDSVVIDIISNHPDVTDIVSYNSAVDSKLRKYSFWFSVTTTFTKESVAMILNYIV